MICQSRQLVRQSGFALVAVMWVVLIAGLILLGVQRSVRANLGMAHNELASASNMIGKFVTGLDMFGDDVSGEVISVRVDESGVMLQVGGQLVPFGGVQTVASAAPDVGGTAT